MIFHHISNHDKGDCLACTNAVFGGQEDDGDEYVDEDGDEDGDEYGYEDGVEMMAEMIMINQLRSICGACS